MNRIAVIPVLALFAGAAMAAPPGMAGGPGMAAADADGDGSITLAEFENAAVERAREHFARLDANSDGLIAGDELQRRGHDRVQDRAGPAGPARAFERLDADASGGVSLAEFGQARRQPPADAFAAADADGSGELDAGEFAALAGAHRAERRQARPQ